LRIQHFFSHSQNYQHFWNQKSSLSCSKASVFDFYFSQMNPVHALHLSFMLCCVQKGSDCIADWNSPTQSQPISLRLILSLFIIICSLFFFFVWCILNDYISDWRGSPCPLLGFETLLDIRERNLWFAPRGDRCWVDLFFIYTVVRIELKSKFILSLKKKHSFFLETVKQAYRSV
jgi:hypothetical protein